MKFIKKVRQFCTLLLVVVLLITTIQTTSVADDLVNLNPYRIVFRGKSLNAFGKTHRDMNIYQVGEGEGAPPVLCIQEGHKIPDCSPAKYEFYEVKPNQAVPIIGPFERYLAMVLAYEWLMSDNYYIPARYGVAQVYYWGCMLGYEHNWALQEQAMRKLQITLDGDPNVMIYYEEMKSHIQQGEAEFNGTSNTSLPDWTGSQQRMMLINGHYELTLDISSCPQLQNTAWSFPNENWTFRLSQDGKNITFQYYGAQEPYGTITSSEIQGIESRYYAYIFTPAASENLQKQLGWLDFEHTMVSASFEVNPFHVPDSSNAQLELYRHSETFDSNYNIDLEKYCAETNQPLEGTTFNVWEDFDFSQVNENGYTEGEPDGNTGEVYLNCMSPDPESDYICDTITTDTAGQARHSDTRYYNYSKTYCMGHPAPEWIECDHDEEEDCNCDDENGRLRGQWMAEQKLCASTCDFHISNSDEENHGQDPTAMENMLLDRDQTYESFISLEYSYHLQEKTARTGYILHGLHSDDEEIETVILSSAQAGGTVRSGAYKSSTMVGHLLEPVYRTVAGMTGFKGYTYPVPDRQDMELEEQRHIESVMEEKTEKDIIEIDIPENNAVGGEKQESVEGESGNQNKGHEAGGTGNEDNVADGAGNGDHMAEGSENEDKETEGSENGDKETGESENGDQETDGTGNDTNETGNGYNESDGSGDEEHDTDNQGKGSHETSGSGTESRKEEESENRDYETYGLKNGSKETGDRTNAGYKAGRLESTDRSTEDSGYRSKRIDNSNHRNQANAAAHHTVLKAIKSPHAKTIIFSPAAIGNNTTLTGEDSGEGSNREPNEGLKREPDEGLKREPDEDTKREPDEDTKREPEEALNREQEEDSNRNPVEDLNKNPGAVPNRVLDQGSGRDPAEHSTKDPEADLTKESAKESSQASDDVTDQQETGQVYEEYIYVRDPITPSYEVEISLTESQPVSQEKGNPVMRFFSALFSDDDSDGEVTMILPSFMDDNLDAMDVSSYGDPGDILYTFKVWDHRTEGRIHINKRDLELYKGDKDRSYGLTQGDSTLEGAVYGLFAAQDMIHPDGKTGIVYNLNDLVSVATTDRKGDASFLTFTEKPGTRLDTDRNIKAPDGVTGPANLYNGSSITSSDMGFGTITYPDYVAANMNQWIGRPLLMGNYYIMELSRSEGYELSVNGISLSESNRSQSSLAVVREAGRADVSGGLSDYNAMDADGSWNDFIAESYRTENGYDITVTGYPDKTEFYEIRTGVETRTFSVPTGSSLQQKLDAEGNPVYQTAKGGEYKIDSDGNPIVKPHTATDSGPGERIPFGEILPYRFRTAPYPRGSASPGDMSQWGQSIEKDYLTEQVNDMLGQIGYKAVSETSPWIEVELKGSTNAQAAAEILDWYTEHNFFDCGKVESVEQKESSYYARLLYDYSAVSDTYPAVYDSVNQKIYVHKTAEVEGGTVSHVRYWIEYPKGRYSLNSRTVSIKEKKAVTSKVVYGEDIDFLIETIYQPVYETYPKGETLLDREGRPIPILERVYEYENREETYDIDVLEPVTAVYDANRGIYTIHVDNTADWSDITESVHTTFRAVTQQKSIHYEGMEMPYNQYLTDVAGAGVSVYAAIPALDAGSYIVSQALVYPGQKQPVQDGGTQDKPVQVLQRVIKQSVKLTKDISQASYDGVNTYGSIHNDPLTVLLGLFNGGNSLQGTKILNQFKFKAYLKSNLENIYVDDTGHIISEDIGTENFKGDVQKIYLPPRDGTGHRLLEIKEDGTYNYVKFFDAMYAADQKSGGVFPAETVKQFAIDYWDIDSYKKEVLSSEPGLNSDAAYQKAIKRAENEAAVYLDPFAGLDKRLAISWDQDKGGGADGDSTTLQCNTKNGKDDYYNSSIMLPYGTYVIAEQTPDHVEKELANRHFNKDYPKEITLPYVPLISQDANTGETDVNYQTGDPYYRYNSRDTPEDLIRKYNIRFNEETHIIQAHGQDGDFEVYKYGLDKDIRPGHSLTSARPYEAEYMDGGNQTVKSYYAGYTSQSEDAGIMDGVIYDGYETDDGQMEIRDNVPVMSGMQTAVHGKFAPMLVPWTVLAPAVDRINPDTGNVETLIPSGGGADFNFVAFAQEDFENTYYSSKLRIEKLDAETGDHIIHDGAVFKIYAAKRDVKKNGSSSAKGTGDVLFGEALDWEGNPVVDADGNKILYPRVGQNNADMDDLPVRLDREGIPQYDETQLIRQEDQEGNETGIFKAYSTIREVVIDGQVQKVPVGYIETYKPLGSGAYVLVEIQAPEGYTKSRPVAFEIYADDVTYYKDQRNHDGTTRGWNQLTAPRYQYAIPVAGETNKFYSQPVSQIQVQDYPSRIEIHKVEDGDSMAGNRNILQKTDAQGKAEPSGGFDGDITVNDKGDLLTYKVHGRKEKLEERGDVRDITYDPDTALWYGYVTKTFDDYSENIIDGTEKALKAMENVKLLYKLDGTFTDKGIRFDIPVSGARLSLYKAIEIEKTSEHIYKGISAFWTDGKVTGIEDTNTGSHREIRVTGKDSGPGELDLWDAVMVDNGPVNLYFYDLDAIDVGKDLATGELCVLDERGNKLCYADSLTGMAYVYDDDGRMLAYTVDENGNKELVKSIQVMEDGTGQTIYEDKSTVDDENGLPVYYTGGHLVTKEESWITDGSTDPYGHPEHSGAVHTISRLPFGPYILQEETVPYSQGYIQTQHMGLVLHDTDEIQKYFMQNAFTKTAFAKIDIRTQREIQGASMTLYCALTDSQGIPLTELDGTYKKGDVYTAWTSGYEYDDNGNLKSDEDGQPVPTSEPHWIDHIPVGFYVLEETICPYEQGYVQSESINIEVKENGDVQSFQMEDDFTAIDIRKYDTKNNDVIYEDSEADLTLYHAKLDEKGDPVLEGGIVQYNEADLIFTFRAATYRDGQEVAATGRAEPDAGGNNPIMKYDYDYKDIPNTYQGRYYFTEEGTVRLEYLPAGDYVLVEESNPEGYATAVPVLITLEEKGHLLEIQRSELGDKPIRLEVSKVNVTGGKEVNGAELAVYAVDAYGNAEENPLILHQPVSDGRYQDIMAVWTSGLDGRYTEEEQKAGEIPEGFEPGDLKPHLIEYIPEGDYILRENMTPYGFLQSVDVPFTIKDSRILQKVEMTNEIPDGILKIIKSDTDNPEEKLQGAEFQLVNKTTGMECETVTTDEQGQAWFNAQPIGYMDREGNFRPYTYVCSETKAAAGHMLTLKPYEFQFEYRNSLTDFIVIEYNPTNESNRVVTDKLLGDTDEMIEGVTLRIEQKTEDGWLTVEQWVTGKQGHYTRGLKAGKYRLVEVKAAEGFHFLAAPVEFAIEDGMKEIPHLVMRNYTSIVDIQKTVSGKDTLLGGAQLQLIEKETGKVVREWTSETEQGQRFYGLEPGIYIIHELQAPSGYERSEDKEILVEENRDLQPSQVDGMQSSNSVLVLRFENKIASSSGGGGGNKPKPETEYIIFKKTDISGKAVKGAEFTFYDQTGRIIGTSVSDANGSFRIRKPQNGTYTFRETKAPAGFALNPDIFSFTVSGADIIRGTYEVTNHELEVTIIKLDGENGLPLSGARLRIEQEEEPGRPEQTAHEGITGADGTLTCHPLAPGRYIIREIQAPQGYQISDTVYSFSIEEDGQVSGNTTIYNWKEKPPARKIGSITAVYKVGNRFGKGTYHFGTGIKDRIRTGDRIPILEMTLTAAFCIAGFVVCCYIRRKEKWTAGRKAVTVILLLVPMVLVLGLDVMAKEITGNEVEIVRLIDESPGEKVPKEELPEGKTGEGLEERLEEGLEERLEEGLEEGLEEESEEKSDEGSEEGSEEGPEEGPEEKPEEENTPVVTTTLSVSGQIIYPAMESAETVPQTAWILVRDQESGIEKKVLLPLTEYHFSNKRWEEGFEMDVTVRNYDADYYDLYGKRIEAGGDQTKLLPEDWEAGLLDQAGLDQGAYRIDQLLWKGPVYENAGERCRDLKAIGRKMAADCTAVYGGEVNRSIFLQDAENIDMKAPLMPEINNGIEGSTEKSPVHLWPGITAGVLLLVMAMAFALRWFKRNCINRRIAESTMSRLNRQAHRRYIMGAVNHLLFAGAVLSLAFLAKAGQAYASGRQTYSEVQELAYNTDTTQNNLSYSIDADESEVSDEGTEDNSNANTISKPRINEPALLAINSEYRFWISVPGTDIEYPVVQHEDNQYYLNHGFGLDEQISGCIFTNCGTIPLAGDNTVVYGHNMKDGSMFAGIQRYDQESFFRKYPAIKIFYKGKWLECPVFSVQLCHENDAGPYTSNLMKEEWTSYLKKMKQASLYDTGISPKGDERLITLSTCHGKNQRFIVQALINGL